MSAGASGRVMRAIGISAPGGPGVLRLEERPVPVPGPGEVLIRVAAAGVNRPDLLQRAGRYPPPHGASDIPGLEVSGVVEVAGPDALPWKVGDAVCALVTGGGYAEYCVAPAAQCLPVPAGMALADAASLPETCFTVWHNVFERGALRPGETLLVQGGSSGIGVTAIQIARALGSEVIATAGSAAKCSACLALGASRAIDYRREDFVAAVLEHTGGRGFDVALDMVAGEVLGREIEAAAEDARIVVIAVQGGARPTIDAARLMVRRITITGSTLRARSVAFKAGIAATLRERVWPLLEARRVLPVVHARLALDEAAGAHALLEEGAHIGKVLLLP